MASSSNLENGKLVRRNGKLVGMLTKSNSED